mgnify:FL=1
MIIISHRGNLNGQNPEKENSPSYITEAVSAGFDVEVDVWWDKNSLWLGHDNPQWKVTEEFLNTIKTKLWIHCKNLEAVEKLMNTQYHWFWHQEDSVTLTSKGYAWCFPEKEITGGIMVDKGQKTSKNIIGVCTDHAQTWKQELKGKRT